MLSPDASWFWFAAAMLSLMAAYALFCRQQRQSRRQSAEAHQAHERLNRRITDLESRLATAANTIQRLEAAACLRSRPPSTVTLAEVESLADDSLLDVSDALGRASSANRFGDRSVVIDPFAGHRESIAIARLADQGLSASEIARQLNQPLGEIELLLSLRPARGAA